MLRYIHANNAVPRQVNIFSSENVSEISTKLGPTKDLPDKKLLIGTQCLEIKDLEPYEGQILYMLSTKEERSRDDNGEIQYTEYLYLVPVKIEWCTYYPAERGVWARDEKYSVHVKFVESGRDGSYSSDGMFRPTFYDKINANKLIQNASELIEEVNYLNQRSSEVDLNIIKEAYDSIQNESKILQCDAFHNSEAKIEIGSSKRKDTLTIYIRVKPTDGPFMSSSMYEINYKPMTDGTVYRSYGAFGSASSSRDWFKNASGNVTEITTDDLFRDILDLQHIYDNLTDGFSDTQLSKEIYSRFK